MDRVVVVGASMIVALCVIAPITFIAWITPSLHQLWCEAAARVPVPNGPGEAVVYGLVAAAVAGVIWPK